MSIVPKCAFCGENAEILPFKCHRCGKVYCSEHRMPENHNCSQEKKESHDIQDEIVYPPEEDIDEVDLTEAEIDELIEGVELLKQTISFEKTFQAEPLSLKAIKGHVYEIYYHVHQTNFNDFLIGVVDGKHSNKGTSPSKQDGKFMYKALSTGMIYVHAMYQASINAYPRIFVDIRIFDLGPSSEDSEVFQGIPILPIEKQIIIELEKLLKETIPIVKEVEDHTFGIVIENNHIKQLGLHDKGLKHFPPSIWNLERLKTLNLSSNHLEFLPEIPKCHESLHKLNLSHNPFLKRLPERIDYLKALKELNLRHCKSLSNLPLKFKQISVMDYYGLDSVDLSHCNFPIIFDLENSFNLFTKSLDFRGNPISLKERKKIHQWIFPELLIEPILFFVEKESKLLEDTPIESLRNTIKNDSNEDNRVVALYIILLNYFSEEITLIKEVILNDESALVITVLFKLLKKINNEMSEILRKEIIERYSKIYEVNKEEVQFFIDLEAERVELGEYDQIKVGRFEDFIFYGPVEPLIQELGIEYNEVFEYFGCSDNFSEPFWVNDGKVIALQIGEFLKRTLPESIGNLKYLEFLDLRETKITKLPQSFQNLKNLRFFFIGCGFDFKNLQNEIKESILLSISRKFSDLGISEMESKALACFEIIYGSFVLCDQLNEEIPNEFVLNNQNRVIAISIYGDLENPDKTMDRKIPHEIILFKNLEEFLIQYSILEIPNYIGEMKKIKKLNLSSNEIDTIPKSINLLKNLEELILNSNKLENIPNDFTDLHNLKRLEINYNKLKSIPKFVFKLKKLEILGLSNNKIKDIPAEIINLKSLKSIDLSLNIIKNVKDSIRNFLDNRISKL